MKELPILMSAPMVRAIIDGRKTQTRRVVKIRSEQPPAWATFAKEGASLTSSGGSRPCGLFYWSEEQSPGEPLKTLRRWPVLPQKHPMAGDYYWTPCPYGKPGDRLYVKEAVWMWCERRPNGTTPTGRQKWLYAPMREAGMFYAAEHPAKPSVGVVSPDTGNQWGWRLKIGRFMPRWASRILLEVVSVRVERLQDITPADCVEEGYKSPDEARYAQDELDALDWYRSLWESLNGAGSWSANPWLWVVEFRRVVP